MGLSVPSRPRGSSGSKNLAADEAAIAANTAAITQLHDAATANATADAALRDRVTTLEGKGSGGVLTTTSAGRLTTTSTGA